MGTGTLHVIAASVATLTLAGSSAHAALVYQNTFDGASATTSVPTVGTGTLAVKNGATGGTTFSSTGGISGGAYVATAGQTYNNVNSAGVASTSVTGGTLLALPDQVTTDTPTVSFNKFTVTYWVKASAAGGFNTANFSRLFIIGGTDNAANTFAMEMRGGKVDVLANNQGTGGSNAVGVTLVPDTWNFIAISYDGTSTNTTNSTSQQALTGSTINAQLYEGTDTTATTRTPVQTAVNATPFTTNTGTLDLSAKSLYLLNRNDLGRAFNGSMDDFRIYDTLLSPSDVETVRLSAIPEPASVIGILTVGAISTLRRRRR